MIKIKYSCEKCGLVDRELKVAPRESQAYDVVAWMNDVAQMIKDDHRWISPKCTAKSAKNVKIPNTGKWIGQEVKQ